MPDTELKKLPPYWALSFSSNKEVADFLGELETACIMRTRPTDDSSVSELPRNANAKRASGLIDLFTSPGGCG